LGTENSLAEINLGMIKGYLTKTILKLMDRTVHWPES
jgi:hypothetical protein